MNWLKHCLTGIDNQTFDPARVLWVVGILSFLGFAGWEVYRSSHFDMTNFATAYGVLLASGAGAVKLKESSEPKPAE